MSGFLGADFDPTVPPDTEGAADGAARIRDIKQRLKTFFAVLFNLENGEMQAGVLPNSVLQAVSGLSAGTYTNITLTVNAQGVITAIESGSSGSFLPSDAIIPPTQGGTGISVAPGQGQFAIGTTAGGFVLGTISATSGGGLKVTLSDGAIALALDPTFFPQFPFHVSAVLPAATAATAVALLPDFGSGVLAGRKVYVTDMLIRVDGGTAWSTASAVTIADSNGTPVKFATIPVAELTANARVGPWTSGITLEDAWSRATGGTASKGLLVAADVNAVGSNLIVSVSGFYQ